MLSLNITTQHWTCLCLAFSFYFINFGTLYIASQISPFVCLLYVYS